MALHATGWANGFAIWDQWSQTCPAKYSAADQTRTWKSFKSSYSKRRVSVASIFHMAKGQRS
jgi:hypothetical protein